MIEAAYDGVDPYPFASPALAGLAHLVLRTFCYGDSVRLQASNVLRSGSIYYLLTFRLARG